MPIKAEFISRFENREYDRGKTVDSYCYIKGWRVKPIYQQMTLSPWLSAAGIIILWHIRSPLLILIFINVAFTPRTLGIGMHFQTLLSCLLKVPRMVLLNPLLWWELGTRLTGPGEWLSYWRVTSKQFCLKCMLHLSSFTAYSLSSILADLKPWWIKITKLVPLRAMKTFIRKEMGHTT